MMYNMRKEFLCLHVFAGEFLATQLYILENENKFF